MAGIQGPEGTPYEAGVFRLELELSERCVARRRLYAIELCAQINQPVIV